jgi:phage tail tape-measure protein
LDDLAATLRPLPAEMARNTEAINRLTDEMRSSLTDEMRSMRADLSALQRQIAQIGWGLSAALVGTLIALIVAVI